MEEKCPPNPASASPAAVPAAIPATPVARPIVTRPPQLSPEEVAELVRNIGTIVTHPEFLRGVRSVVAQIKEFWAALRPALAAVGSVVMFLGEAMIKLPAELRTSVLHLAHRGWFFDPHMPLQNMWHTKALIESGKPEEADAYMAAHFEARLDQIEGELAAALPARAPKFKSAFAAHRRGEFDLSILAFMAQADGVCAELRGGHFFLKNRGTRKPEAAAYAASFESNFIDKIAHLALAEDLPIREQMRMRLANGSTGLNRHAVMHGESLDYDTKENSLRALSLLNYVALGLNLGDGSALAEAGKSPLASIAKAAAISAEDTDARPK
jgi:hypothetical protein